MSSLTLIFHIIVGSIALGAGTAAMIYRKGSPRHRLAGKYFVISMLLMTSSGALLAYLKPATISVLAGVLTFYMVASSWMTVRRRAGTVGGFEPLALGVVLLNGVACFYFGYAAASSETGFIEGIKIPAGVYYYFGVVCILAAAGDINLLLRKGIHGAFRIARHVWRMCFAFYIAASSLLMGNPQVFPEAVRGTLVLSGPVILLVMVSLYWLIRVLFTGMFKKPQLAS
ncbi:MAG: hypothetical protein AAF431_07270 [Pseudomonadota bacterium]